MCCAPPTVTRADALGFLASAASCRLLKQGAADMLAHFDRLGTSIGPPDPTDASNNSHGSALGFGNLTSCISRSLLDSGGFIPDYTARCDLPL